MIQIRRSRLSLALTWKIWLELIQEEEEAWQRAYATHADDDDTDFCKTIGKGRCKDNLETLCHTKALSELLSFRSTKKSTILDSFNEFATGLTLTFDYF